MLRRKRGGADYDLSDSDDGGEARRRMKRRQFAKMQKALFADERVSKVAENPRNQAFLRTIEDVGSDDDMDFIFERPAPTATPASGDTSSQDREAAVAIPDSQPGPSVTTTAATSAERLPAPQRRRARDDKKPVSIGQIRESLSNLLEEPNTSSVIPSTDLASDSDDDDKDASNNHRPQGSSDKENRRHRTHVAIVDRITLKRNASSSSSTSTTTSDGRRRQAFTATGSSSTFKVPALLRRATTNSLASTTSTSTTTSTTSGGIGEDAKIRSKPSGNGGRRSGVNYFARENERRAAAAESERRREARRWKGAEGRGSVVGGLFGGGKFE